MVSIISVLAIIAAAVAFGLFGFWTLRRDRFPRVGSVEPLDMSRGEIALAWGVAAVPLGLVFLIGDRRVGTDWVPWMAVLLLAIGLICAILRRILYRRWR